MLCGGLTPAPMLRRYTGPNALVLEQGAAIETALLRVMGAGFKPALLLDKDNLHDFQRKPIDRIGMNGRYCVE